VGGEGPIPRRLRRASRPSLLRLRSQKAVAPLRMNGKGAGRLMLVVIFQVNVEFEDGLGFSPEGEPGEG
jgi:hypothetical protein